MALVRVACAVRLSFWIDMQHDTGDLRPVCALTFRLQKTHVRDDVQFVIGRQRRLIRSDVRDVRV
ncbi:hypothetical protein QU42_26095 [Bradyrhizobium sp. UASWS1016]|nr:hypothetical protein QU42_26095 [Bradyrhizobium sp. UASWS1016]